MKCGKTHDFQSLSSLADELQIVGFGVVLVISEGIGDSEDK